MGTHHSHLSQTDRVAIQLLLQAGWSRRGIADKLGFSPSSVARSFAASPLRRRLRAAIGQRRPNSAVSSDVRRRGARDENSARISRRIFGGLCSMGCVVVGRPNRSRARRLNGCSAARARRQEPAGSACAALPVAPDFSYQRQRWRSPFPARARHAPQRRGASR
jgi:hypothetical protein